MQTAPPWLTSVARPGFEPVKLDLDQSGKGRFHKSTYISSPCWIRARGRRKADQRATGRGPLRRALPSALRAPASIFETTCSIQPAFRASSCVSSTAEPIWSSAHAIRLRSRPHSISHCSRLRPASSGELHAIALPTPVRSAHQAWRACMGSHGALLHSRLCSVPHVNEIPLPAGQSTLSKVEAWWNRSPETHHRPILLSCLSSFGVAGI